MDIITGVRQLIQDLVSPDLKAIKEKQEALARELELTRQSTSAQFEAQRQYTTAQLDAVKQSTAAQLDALRQSTTAQMESLKEYTTVQTDALLKNIEAFRAEFRAEMVLLRTNNQLEVMRQIAPIAERLAALEQQR